MWDKFGIQIHYISKDIIDAGFCNAQSDRPGKSIRQMTNHDAAARILAGAN